MWLFLQVVVYIIGLKRPVYHVYLYVVVVETEKP